MKTSTTSLLPDKSSQVSLNDIWQQTIVLAVIAVANLTTPAFAQYGAPGISTLRDPLIYGASYTYPGVPAYPCMPPPIGDGDCSPYVTPGQLNGPTFEPWANRIPANQIDQPNSIINMPFSPATAFPPGQAGNKVSPPPPPSTPGKDPGMLRNPAEYKSVAAEVLINEDGSYPVGLAPGKHRGGKTTQDFGVKRTVVGVREMSQLNDFGQRLKQKPDLANTPWTAQDGPKPMKPSELPGKTLPPLPRQITHDLYGAPMLSNTNGGMIPLTTIAPY